MTKPSFPGKYMRTNSSNGSRSPALTLTRTVGLLPARAPSAAAHASRLLIRSISSILENTYGLQSLIARRPWSSTSFPAQRSHSQRACVRGTRLATLRSTLQTCPDSVFSAEFDNDTSPGGNCPAFCSSPGAFVFMLKDGKEDAHSLFTPVKWNLREGEEELAVQCSPYFPVHFGQGDLTVVGADSDATFWTKPHSFDIPTASSLLGLKGQPMKEVEDFRKPSSGTGSLVQQASNTWWAEIALCHKRC